MEMSELAIYHRRCILERYKRIKMAMTTESSNERESRPSPRVNYFLLPFAWNFSSIDIPNQQLSFEDLFSTAFLPPPPPPPPQSETIRSPLYRTIEERLASFENFPSGNSIPQQQLAEAGLYFTGYGDLCRCFSCGGFLKALSSGDDPIKEHARYFPKCSLTNRLKGRQHVQFLQEVELENEHICGGKDDIGGCYTSSQRSDRTGNISGREDICCFVNGGCIKGGRLCDKTIGEKDTNCSRDTYRNKSKRYTTRQRDVIKNASTSERNQHSASQTTQDSFEYTSVLRKSTKHAVLHMNPRLVLDEFTTCGFLTNIEIRDIEELQLTSEKNRAILRKVMTKGVNGYKKFKSALKESNQTHLLDLLLREELS